MIMKNTWKFLVLAVALVAVVAIGIFGGRWYGDNRKPNFSKNYELFVYPGMETSSRTGRQILYHPAARAAQNNHN